MKTGPGLQKFNMVDIFSGVGGFTLGFSRYCESPNWCFLPRLMVDLDPEARLVMNRNCPEIPFLVADIASLSGEDIRRSARLSPGEEVHVLVGGPPCQGFSRAGRRALDDPRNKLVLDYLRLVTEIRPLVAVMENVPMVTSSQHGNVMDEIVAALTKIGYSSFYDVLLASDYGVPQHRRRAILVAYRSDLHRLPSRPRKTHESFGNAADLLDLSQKVRFEDHLHAYVSVEEAIGDLPALAAGDGSDVTTYGAAPSSDYQKWARIGSIAVFNHRARAHSKDYLEKVSVIREGGRNQDLPADVRFSDTYFSQAYARLSRHGIAQTITTHFGNPGSGRFLHYRDLRSLTVREAARIQSFRDNFVFSGTLSTQMRHVGNAVPPLMARAIASVVGDELYQHFRDGRADSVAGDHHEPVRPLRLPSS